MCRVFCRSGIFVLGLVLMIGASPAWSQSVNYGTVTGNVILPDGAPGAGTAVVLEGPALVSGSWATVADNTGHFVFLRVPPGTYTATASLSGFNTAQYEDFVIKAGSSVALDFALEIAPTSGEILVTSEMPIVDTKSSTISTSFGSDMLEVIPTSRESFYDLALTAPGMSSVGADESWLPSASAYGSAANENIFLVNGVNTTNPRGASWGSLVKVNYDTVQEVKVLSLGSQAEYGSFSGAAVDVLTKSGGNEFHGSAAYYGQIGDAADNMTTSFSEDWLWYSPTRGELVSYPDDWEVAATLGGPIVKDKLWFYAGYDHRDTEYNEALRALPVLGDFDLYDLKLTGQIGTDHRLWLGLHVEDSFEKNVTWGPFDPSMVYYSGTDNTTAQFEYQWVASDRDLFGFKYLGFDTEQHPTIPVEYGYPGAINWWKWTPVGGLGVDGDFPYVEAQQSRRDTFQADFTHYADDWAGQHELKFGVQYTTANGDWYGGYFQGYSRMAYPYSGWGGRSVEYFNNGWWSGDATWQWSPLDTFPMYMRETVRNPWLNVREADNQAAFVDDQWVVSDRLTLNLGVRYDRMQANYGPGKVYELFNDPSDVDNPTLIRDTEGYDVYDFKNWSPRIGFAWTLTGDGKTVLRGHYGRYQAPLSIEALRRLGPDMGEQIVDTWFYWFPYDEVDHNGNNWIDVDEVIWATRQLSGMEPSVLMSHEVSPASFRLEVEDGTDNPYTDQFNISLQRQLGRDLAIELSYIYKKTQNFIILDAYDLATGEYFDWHTLPYTTWTGYQTPAWTVTINDFNGDGVINGDDAGYPSNDATRGWRARNLNSWEGQDVSRTYQGVQLVLTKRFSNRWQGNFAINYTNTDGFYPRTVNQYWYIDGPLTMDTPFGTSPNHFQNNLSGPALMTPEWMAKLAGSYTIPFIETDFGFRVRYDSGRALWPTDNSFPVYASWMGEFDPETQFTSTGWNNVMVADDPDDPQWLPATTIFDLNLGKRFNIGGDMGITVSLDVLNAFNENSPNKVGYTVDDYGEVQSLVVPRYYRLGLKFEF
ncbi:MAG: TonB-dependent receptor [Acidobacteria bacterium]|jgi:outer membrane receptor protein involved in Fe transport|nr:TonB-dependent receptor [Acidobacteriota bacterium]